MYKLLVYAYLCRLNLNDGQAFTDHLDKLFLNEPSNDLLLELELCDADKSFSRLKRYFDYEKDNFDIDFFGETLFNELYKIYHSEMISLQMFAEKCYELSNNLPLCVDRYEQPFYLLNFIDDMIDLNSLIEIEESIEEMLTFYRR